MSSKRKFYLPADDSGKLLWLINFREKIQPYAVMLGLDPMVVPQINTDTDTFSSILLFQNNLKNTAEAYTAFKNQLRNGKNPLGSLPVLPPAPMVPPNARNDIFGHIARLVQTIKNHPNYTESIGDDLRIIGEETPVNPNEWKPVLKAEIISGAPNIKWTKGDADGIKIKVNRGAGYEFLAVDTRPDYPDKHPLPPFGQSAVWKYTAIYIVKDEEVGQWSDELTVNVAGVP